MILKEVTIRNYRCYSSHPYKTGCFFKRNDVKDLAERIDEWF